MKTNRLNLYFAGIAVFAGVAVTAFTIYSNRQTVEMSGEYTFIDYAPVSEEPARGLAGVEARSVKQLLEVAREASAQGKFDECLRKLNALHQEINELENSRELKLFCTQGKARKKQLDERRRLKRNNKI